MYKEINLPAEETPFWQFTLTRNTKKKKWFVYADGKKAFEVSINDCSDAVELLQLFVEAWDSEAVTLP